MTTKAFDNVPPCSYGDGVPAFAGQYGARYIDTVTDIEYWYNGSAWKPMGGGSGGNGLPYIIGPSGWYIYSEEVSGPYTGAFTVQAAYDAVVGSNFLYLKGGDGGPYGGGVSIQGGYGSAQGGNIDLNTQNTAVIRLTAAAGSGGSAINISTGGGSGGNVRISADGDLILSNLPVVGGGPAGSVWNNAGVLNIN